MSRKCSGWDNAVAESIFGTSSQELGRWARWTDVTAARDEVGRWIHAFYNDTRLHATIGFSFMTPADGATVAPDAALTLVAEVGDSESPLEELVLFWQRSDGVTLIGEQRSTDSTVSLTLATGLAEGTYTVTLIAADPQAASGEDTVTFDVRTLPPDTGDTGNDTGDSADTGDSGDSGGGDTGDPGPTAPEADVDTAGCEGTDVDASLWTVIPEGPIFVDTVLDLAGSPYCVAGTVSMAAGTSLTIEAGVRVLGAQTPASLVRWDGDGGAVDITGEPFAPSLIQRVSFGTEDGEDVPDDLTARDAHIIAVFLQAVRLRADDVTTTWHAPWAGYSVSWLVGFPSLEVTNSTTYSATLAGADTLVEDSALVMGIVDSDGPLRMTRTSMYAGSLRLRPDRASSQTDVVLDSVRFEATWVLSAGPELTPANLLQWQASDSVFVGVRWMDQLRGSPFGDDRAVELPLASTFARNFFVRNHAWFRLTGEDGAFTNNAFADPQLTDVVIDPGHAVISIATDATATVTRNSFLGFDDALGHLAIGLDTTHEDASSRAGYGAALDATGNHYGTTDAATVQRLRHDRTDDASAFGYYIRPDPVLAVHHADTPDPTPWR